MQLIELIKELAFHLLSRCEKVLVRNALAHLLLQLFQGLDAKRVGERIVEHDGVGRLDRLHRHIELRVAAGDAFGGVIVGKFHLDRAALAGVVADQLILEAGD